MSFFNNFFPEDCRHLELFRDAENVGVDSKPLGPLVPEIQYFASRFPHSKSMSHSVWKPRVRVSVREANPADASYFGIAFDQKTVESVDHVLSQEKHTGKSLVLDREKKQSWAEKNDDSLNSKAREAGWCIETDKQSEAKKSQHEKNALGTGWCSEKKDSGIWAKGRKGEKPHPKHPAVDG